MPPSRPWGRPIPAGGFPAAPACAPFPLALLLGALRPSLVWLAFLLSEGAACLTALLLYRRTARGRLAGMEE
ncbi:MAG: hypothetical protein ACLRIS_02855 [Flavonifractor plautii]